MKQVVRNERGINKYLRPKNFCLKKNLGGNYIA